MTQEERVLNYINEFGSITSLDVFQDLGVSRLSAKIFNLRKRYDIKDKTEKSKNRWDDEVHFKRYYLEKKEN